MTIIKIKELSDVIDIAQWTNFDQNLYYDKASHKIIIDSVEFYDEVNLMDDANDEYISIVVEPFSRDMFLSFFLTIKNDTVKQMFFDKFHGSKKYRKVKDLFPRYHLLEAFYHYKDDYMLKIAEKWCNENNISYLDFDEK